MRGTYRMERNLGLVVVIFLIIGVVGWTMNLAKLINADVLTGMEIARGIGIFAAPFGALLGYF